MGVGSWRLDVDGFERDRLVHAFALLCGVMPRARPVKTRGLTHVALAVRDPQRSLQFYRAVLDFDDRPDLGRPNGVWDLGSAEASELAKLAETTYRDVNIGLANQFARFADTVGVDVAKVIEACNSQPYSHIHSPGIAVGGHCIPVYPRMYLWNDPTATVVSAAREANTAMPETTRRTMPNKAQPR